MAYTLHLGDCLEYMANMESDSADSIITDPPYGLTFMGKEWDHGVPGVPFWAEALRVAKPGATLLAFGGTRTFHRLACAIEDAGWEIRDCIMWIHGQGFPKSSNIAKTTASAQWDGWGTALKPAFEPIIVAMKPIDGTFANNALGHGVAGLWIDGARVGHTVETWPKTRSFASGISSGYTQGIQKGPTQFTGETPQGRWPANVIHDGSDEVVAGFPVTKAATSRTNAGHESIGRALFGGGWAGPLYPDTGSAARFFYCAKASRSERTHNGRIENKHPTVKPLELMRYLCRLTKTPTGGIVLDPFMGSGTTGVAAIMEGRDFVGIERDVESHHTAKERIGLAVVDVAFDTLPLLREAAD